MVSEHANPLATLGGVDAGGQNVHVAALATELGRQGIEVVVYTRRDSTRPEQTVALAPGVTVDHICAGPARPVPKDELVRWMPAFARELAGRWTGNAPDLVHAHFWMSGLASCQASRPLGIPVVQTFHALGVVKRRHQGAKDTSPARRLRVERLLARGVDHIVATCSDEVFELRRLGADGRRISVVPCGVDLARFHPGGPIAPRAPGRHRLVVVGRLVERKGIADVIAALGRLPETEMVVAGGPAYADLERDTDVRRLRAIAAEHGVAGRVTLLGRVGHQAMPALLRSADVVVCVPWYEPFGIVPIEAMACGVPVVASAVGGMIDTVVDDVTGVHVPARAPVPLAATLRRLLCDPDLRRRLGEAGAARTRSRFGWERVGRATADVYSDLLGIRRSRRSEARR
ncbi:MAG TPA: glycosyltransferase [Acidimicrobiales bacterium]|nr:glycosyltransferase [Acidimicrobiales bacterium]